MAPAVGRTPYAAGPRRARWRWVAPALLLVPLLEVVVIIAVGRAIGAWPTFLVLLAASLLGVWLVRREGARAWRALQESLRSGQMPRRELADGALVLVGAALLIPPGFVTGVLGLLALLPPTRALVRPVLAAAVARRVLGGGVGRSSPGAPPPVVPGHVVPPPAGEPDR